MSINTQPMPAILKPVVVPKFTSLKSTLLSFFGGFFLSYLALQQISGGEGVLKGFNILTEKVPGHFDMILSPDNSEYMNLPGISVLVGGLWVMNVGYWGFNQYIIQRALAAKSIQEAQKGIAARLGGDEFIIVLRDAISPEDIEALGRKLSDALAKPYFIQDESVYCTASIGIAFYPSDAADMDALLKNADQAMYKAKARGRNSVHYFASGSIQITEENNAP